MKKINRIGWLLLWLVAMGFSQIPQKALSSEGDIVWTDTYHGEGESNLLNIGEDIAVDREGNVYVVGYVSAARENEDIWVRKYDSEGNIVWTRTHSGPFHLSDRGYGIAVDCNGNVYVTGSDYNNTRFWICKYDSNGNEVLWPENNIDNSHVKIGNDIAIDTSGNIYVTGVKFDRFWLRKYDPDGNEVWYKTKVNVLAGTGVAVDVSGNVYVTGEILKEGDIWVCKYNSSGEVIWERTYSGSDRIGLKLCNGIAVDREGNVYVTGRDYPPDSESSYIFICKYNFKGDIMWTRTHNDTDKGKGNDIAVDSLGNVYVIGRQYVEVGDSNIWIRKYDSSGEILWTKRYDEGGGEEGGKGIAVDEYGNVYVTGYKRFITQDWDWNIWVCKLEGPHILLKSDTFMATAFNISRKVARDSKGNIHVVYQSQNDIYYAKSSNNGQTWSIPVNLSKSENFLSVAPCIAIGSDDIIHVVWSEARFSEPFYLASPPPYGAEYESDIYYIGYYGTSSSWTKPVNISRSNELSNSCCLTIDSKDNLYVVWSEGAEDIYYAHAPRGQGSIETAWVSGRVTFLKPDTPFPGTVGAWTPSIMVDSEDNLHIVWSQGPLRMNTPDNYIFYTKGKTSFTADGLIIETSFISPIKISKSVVPGFPRSYTPCIVTDIFDNIHVVWDEIVHWENDFCILRHAIAVPLGEKWEEIPVYWCSYNKAKNSWQEQIDILSSSKSSLPSAFYAHTSIGRDHYGNLYAIWYEADSLHLVPKIYYSIYPNYRWQTDPAYKWTPPFVIGEGQYPNMGAHISPAGVDIVWTEKDKDSYNIRYKNMPLIQKGARAEVYDIKPGDPEWPPNVSEENSIVVKANIIDEAGEPNRDYVDIILGIPDGITRSSDLEGRVFKYKNAEAPAQPCDGPMDELPYERTVPPQFVVKEDGADNPVCVIVRLFPGDPIIAVVGPVLTVSPTSGTVGTIVEVKAERYEPNESVRIDFGTTISIAVGVADITGVFTATFTVDTQPADTITVTATGLISGLRASAIFVIEGTIITGKILYNGEAVTKYTNQPAMFWMRDEDTGKAVEISSTYDNNTGSYSIFNVAPGKYGISVRLDAAEPFGGRLWPGDLDGWKSPVIVQEGQITITQDLSCERVIHLTAPVDNMSEIGHIGDPPDIYYTKEMVFQWDPIPEASSYRIQIRKYQSPHSYITVVGTTTIANQLTIPLDNSEENQYYQFHLYAYNEDEILVGKLMLNYDNGLGWAYKFRVATKASISITPTSGTIGTTVYINGRNFAPNEQVRIDFGTTRSITTAIADVNGNFSAVFVVDTQPAGTITITATGTISNKKATAIFTFLSSPPIITQIIPKSGLNTKEVKVTIFGNNFMHGCKVNLLRNGLIDIEGKDVKVIDPNMLTSKFSLAGACPGMRDIVVTNPDGQCAKLGSCFYVVKSISLPIEYDKQQPSYLPLDVVVDYGYDTIHLMNGAGVPLYKKADKYDQFLQYLSKIEKVPEVFIVGKEAPFTHSMGPILSFGGENVTFPTVGEEKESRCLLDPNELNLRIKAIQKFVDDVHSKGVKKMLVYTCAVTMFDYPLESPATQTCKIGFGEFYDRWDIYATKFYLGKKPDDNVPKENWVQRDWTGSYSYKTKSSYEPLARYRMCINAPGWRLWQKIITWWTSKVGYDGVFIDGNLNVHQCYCTYCRKISSEFEDLTIQWKPKIKVNDTWVWVDNLPHPAWLKSYLDFFNELRAEGRNINKDFWIGANYTNLPYQREIAEHIDISMIEHGWLGAGRWLWSNGVWTGFYTEPVKDPKIGVLHNRSVPLIEPFHLQNIWLLQLAYTMKGKNGRHFLYGAPAISKVHHQEYLKFIHNKDSALLALAEGAAFGGGASVHVVGLYPFNEKWYQYYAPAHEARKNFFKFIHKYPNLYEGLFPAGDVAILVFPNHQIEALLEAQQVHERLLWKGILVDVINGETVSEEILSRYQYVIVPGDKKTLPLPLWIENSLSSKYLYSPDPITKDEKDKCVKAWNEYANEWKKYKNGKIGTPPTPPTPPLRITKLSEIADKQCANVKALVLPSESKIQACLWMNEDKSRMVLHLLNFNVPIGYNNEGKVQIVKKIPVQIRLPLNQQVQDIKIFSPDIKQGLPISFTTDETTVQFVIPNIRVYTVCEISLIEKVPPLPPQKDDDKLLVGHWPYGPLYAVYVDEKYMYVNNGTVLEILRLNDLLNKNVTPQPISKVKTSLNPIVKIIKDGQYLYLANKAGGLRIIDVKDPTSPKQLGYYVEGKDSYCMDVCIIGNYAYLAYGKAGLKIIDTSNKFCLTKIGECSFSGAFAFAVDVVDNYAYVATNGGLKVVNISDPRNPIVINKYIQDIRAEDVVVKDEYVYVACKDGLRIFKIESEGTLTLSSYPIKGTYTYPRITISDGNYAYFSCKRAIYIIDVSVKNNPRKINEIEGYIEEEDEWSLGAQTEKSSMVEIRSVFIANNYAYVVCYDCWLCIFKTNDLEEKKEGERYSVRGRYKTAGYVESVSIKDNYLYIANYGGDLKRLNVSNPANPKVESYIKTEPYTRWIRLFNNYLYFGSKFKIIDISDPENPQEVKIYYNTFNDEEIRKGVWGGLIKDNYAYLLCPYDFDKDTTARALRVMSINKIDETHFKFCEIGNYINDIRSITTVFWDVSVRNNYAYVVGVEHGDKKNSYLYVFDITTLPNIKLISKEKLYRSDWTETHKITIKDNYIFITSCLGGLQIWKIKDSGRIKMILKDLGVYVPMGLFVTHKIEKDNNSYIVYIGSQKGLVILEVKDLDSEKPQIEILYKEDDVEGYIREIVADNNYIYIAAGEGGVRIFRRIKPEVLSPIVTQIVPNSGLNTSRVEVTIFGSNFVAGAIVKLSKAGLPDIIATNVNVVAPNYLTCTFDLTGVVAGLRDVVVTNPDGQAGRLPDGFTITKGSPPWDVNQDGRIDIFDLVIVARNFGQSVPPADARADVDKNGKVDIFDLVLVAKHFGEVYGGGTPAPAKDAVTIAEISQTHTPDTTFTVDVTADEVRDAYGFQFELAFDPNVLEVVSVSEGAFLKNGDETTYWMQPVVDSKAGRITGACTRMGTKDGVSGSGVLASMVFRAKGYGVSSLQLKKVLLASPQATPVQAQVRLAGSAPSLPASTDVLQNYPNPFNPECWIPYTLSEQAHVVIRIYNITGQLIRTLDLGIKQPGIYVNKDRAAYWDGLNDEGEEVASGVYFYRLYAGDKVSTKKMVVLK